MREDQVEHAAADADARLELQLDRLVLPVAVLLVDLLAESEGAGRRKRRIFFGDTEESPWRRSEVRSDVRGEVRCQR